MEFIGCLPTVHDKLDMNEQSSTPGAPGEGLLRIFVDASDNLKAKKHDGTILTYSTGSSPVSSVFGRTGAVAASSGDYSFSQIGSTPTTLAGYGITDGASTTSLATFDQGVTVNGAALTVSSNGIFGNWISAQGNGLRSQNFGKSTQAYGDESTCSGEESVAGLNGTASGYQADAESESCAYGWKTYARAGSIAIGEGTQVTGYNSIGLGRGTSCSTNNSTVIGKNAVSTADNQFVAAGGTDPSEKISNVFFGNGVIHSVPAGFTINGTGGQGTNIVGGNITLAGGQGTGTGTGGSVKIQVAPAGSSGSSSNALEDALVVDSTKLATFSGSVKIGGGAAITKVLAVTSSQSVGAVSANSISTFDVTVTGAVAGDVVSIGCPSNLDSALMATGFVSATDTVTVQLANPTGSGSSSFTGTFRVMVTKF